MAGTNQAPTASTFDLVPPRRPVLNDFNGAAKSDDAVFPPDPVTMPNAPEDNLKAKLAVAVGAVMPVLLFSVVGGTVPTLFGLITASSTVVPSTLTILRNAVGDVSITWPANTFPPPTVYPTACTNAGAAGDADVVPITNGVRVRTYNPAGAATDFSFTVTLY